MNIISYSKYSTSPTYKLFKNQRHNLSYSIRIYKFIHLISFTLSYLTSWIENCLRKKNENERRIEVEEMNGGKCVEAVQEHQEIYILFQT